MTVTLITSPHHPSCPYGTAWRGLCPCPPIHLEDPMTHPSQTRHLLGPDNGKGRADTTIDPTPAATDLTVDLTAAAMHIVAASDHLWTQEADHAAVLRFRAMTALWEDLTGLHGPAAIDLAREVATHPRHITAAVVPF